MLFYHSVEVSMILFLSARWNSFNNSSNFCDKVNTYGSLGFVSKVSYISFLVISIFIFKLQDTLYFTSVFYVSYFSLATLFNTAPYIVIHNQSNHLSNISESERESFCIDNFVHYAYNRNKRSN